MTINIKITSDETIEHNGKQYRPVAIRCPKDGETYITRRGLVRTAGHDFIHVAWCIILKEVIPPYRTPTDEDAKQRPMAEFWDDEHDIKAKRELLAVLCDSEHKFVSNNGGLVSVWKHCRISNEKATNDNL